MKLTLDTPNEVKVRCLFKTDLDNLIHIGGSKQVSLLWVDGILIDFSEYPTSEKEVRECPDVFYVDTIAYAECPEYTPETKYNGFSVDVLDVTGNSFFDELAKELKK